MRRRLSLLCIPLLVPLLLAASGDPGFVPAHPWLSATQVSWALGPYKIVDSDIKTRFETSEQVVELLADGSVQRTYRFVLRHPEGKLELLGVGLALLDQRRGTEVTRFSASHAGGGGPRFFGEDVLSEVTADGGGRYFDGDRVLVLNLPPLSAGTLTMELVTVTGPDPDFPGLLRGVLWLQDVFPAYVRDLRIRVPAEQTVQFEQRFFTAEIDESVSRGANPVREYHLRVRDLFPFVREHGAPTPYAGRLGLYYSNTGFAEYGATWRAHWDERLVADEAMGAFAREAVVGAETTAQRALAIHDAVANGWSYLGFYPGESGLIPHPVTETFAARVGDCKDKTALMISLMDQVGVEAHPALGYGGDRVPRAEVPGALISNHAWVYVVDAEHPDGGFFVDSVDSGYASSPPGRWLSDRHALVLFDDRPASLVAVPAVGPEHLGTEDDATIEVRPDGSARVVLVQRWRGEAANRRHGERRQQRDDVWRRQAERDVLAGWAGARFEELTEGPGADGSWERRAVFVSSSVIDRQGDLAIFVPPWIQRWSGSALDQRERWDPKVLRPQTHRSTLRLELPENARIQSMPASSEHAFGAWSGRFEAAGNYRSATLSLEMTTARDRMFRADAEREQEHLRWAEQAQRAPILLSWGLGS